MREFCTAFLAYCVLFGVSFAETPLSKYGQIQNVQNYSTNHFYNGLYNQKAPQAIYATGADLSSADCQSAVSTLIAAHCALNNNCIGMQLSDVRPALMLGLSQMPGHNYATSCAGFVDTAFRDFQSRHRLNNMANMPVAFPESSGIANPNAFAPIVAAKPAPATQNQMVGVGNPNGTGLNRNATFPRSVADLSLSDLMAVKAEGYEPFKDMEAYHEIDIIAPGEEYYTERQLAELNAQQQKDATSLSKEEYCKKYPLDQERCNPTEQTYQYVVDIGSLQESVAAGQFNGQTIGGTSVVQSNSVVGGACYPASKDNVFRNKVMTTGQYEKISPAFEKAMITIFRKEGACGTILGDKCGYTCYGLGSGPACMNMDVSKLTRADAERIYYERWWKPNNLELLPDVISGDVFMACIASGAKTAISQFRKFLNLPNGYKIDNEVVEAVKNYNGDIHNDWMDVRQAFLVKVAATRYKNSVLTGWMNAVKLVRENGCHVVPKNPIYR